MACLERAYELAHRQENPVLRVQCLEALVLQAATDERAPHEVLARLARALEGIRGTPQERQQLMRDRGLAPTVDVLALARPA